MLTPDQVDALKPGDRLRFQDPACGRCSRDVEIATVEYHKGTDIIRIVATDNSVLEAFSEELALITE